MPEAVDGCMRQAIAYRGRDASGEWSDGRRIRLFHSRLSIIDLADGQQPMADVESRHVIVFNGEIYNYLELREEYERLGARFRTHSDTEVILEGYKLKGKKVCDDLNGMFAFALWDATVDRLFLARDHLGKKPLYWMSTSDGFYFASTIDAFRGLKEWRGDMDPVGIFAYSVMGSFPEAETIYRDVSAIPYASRGFVGPGDSEPRLERYWRMRFGTKRASSSGDLMDEYEGLLGNATSIRLRADVPVALTFSGGVDSGSIAAICARQIGVDLDCYTIDYHTPEDPSEEVLAAEQVAGMLGLPWSYIQFDYHKDLITDLPRVYSFFDQPCQQLALVYSLRLYETIKPRATVVVTGNGADELYTGYVSDHLVRRRDLIRGLLRVMPEALLSTVLRPARNRLEYYRIGGHPVHENYRMNMDAYIKAFISDSDARGRALLLVEEIQAEHEASGVDSFMDLMMFNGLTVAAVDSNYRLPDITGLAGQVEVRSPFLDYRMVEFAAALPHNLKVRQPFGKGRHKWLPKKFYEGQVGDEVAWSRKKGMGFNLKWQHNMVDDPNYRSAFEDAYDAAETAGVDSRPYREAQTKYVEDMKSGIDYPASAGIMINGFMLGAWLGREAVQESALPSDGAESGITQQAAPLQSS